MKSILVFLTFFLSLSLSFSASYAVDPPSIHGMVLLGRQTLYVSHLPMFHRPHDYQVIMEVKLSSQQGNPQALYVADQQRTNTKLYTLVPEQNFVLPQVVQNRTSFLASIYRGHFERGGTLILQHVRVDIKAVLHFRKFEPSAAPAESEYFLFGNARESFLAHLIRTCPDYDHLVAVATSSMASGKIRILAQARSVPLKEGATYRYQSAQGTGSLKVLRDFYYETGDLACMGHHESL